MDVTAYIYGYHGDLNETVLIGDVDDESKHLCMTAYKCLQRGIETVKPGTRYRDIGEEVTKLATQRKCSVVKSYCGHGIGTLFHCAPNIPHYAKNKAVGSMKEGARVHHRAHDQRRRLAGRRRGRMGGPP